MEVLRISLTVYDTTSFVSYCQQNNQEFDSVLNIKVVFQLLPCHCGCKTKYA